MDLIQNYTSDSDNEEEHLESEKLNEKLSANASPAVHSPPPIQIFLQQYQNMRSGSKVSTIFTAIPWNPPITTLSQLDKAVKYVVSQSPTLSKNYRFVVPNKDPYRVEKHHITIYPTLHMKEAVESQYVDHVREQLAQMKPPTSLLFKGTIPSSPLSKILNKSRESIRFKFEDFIRIGTSPLKDTLFCTLRIKQTADASRYLSSLVECCTKSAEKCGAQLQFPELLEDPMHVSIATGYVIRSSISNEEVDRINHQLSSINVSDFTKDLEVTVDELTIRNSFEMTSTSLPLV